MFLTLSPSPSRGRVVHWGRVVVDCAKIVAKRMLLFDSQQYGTITTIRQQPTFWYDEFLFQLCFLIKSRWWNNYTNRNYRYQWPLDTTRMRRKLWILLIWQTLEDFIQDIDGTITPDTQVVSEQQHDGSDGSYEQDFVPEHAQTPISATISRRSSRQEVVRNSRDSRNSHSQSVRLDESVGSIDYDNYVDDTQQILDMIDKTIPLTVKRKSVADESPQVVSFATSMARYTDR